MKKLVIAILAVFYLSTSAGATLHLHYCMDKLVDWKLWPNEKKEDKCSGCGMEKPEAKDNGCCKDEHKQIKLENDHRAADSYQSTHLFSVIITVAHFQLPLLDPPSVTEESLTSLDPTRSSGLAAYIRYRVFRI